MGNRSLIIIRSKDFDNNNEIRFYGHWSGTDNFTAVQNVMARTGRVGDPSYLTAQLFHEFSVNLGAYDGELSFGIYTAETGSDEGWTDSPTVYINADFGYYEYDGTTYEARPNSSVKPPKILNCEPDVVY
jgi:hypothetical protein